MRKMQNKRRCYFVSVRGPTIRMDEPSISKDKWRKKHTFPHLFLNTLIQHQYECAKCNLLERQHGRPIKMFNVSYPLT